MFRTTLVAGLMAGASLIAMADSPAATTIWALDSQNHLTRIDAGTRRAGPTMMVKGTTAPLMAIDVRPTDGKIYGLTADQHIVTIDTATGMAKMVSKLDKPIETGPRAAINFNPTVDRLRVIGMNGNNYRINVDTGAVIVDGALKYAAGTRLAGSIPTVTAAAYTNAVAGAKTTALYTFDTMLGQFNLQAPPNDGVQQVKAELNTKLPYGIGFDILSDGQGGETAYLVANATLHHVNLADGKITADGPIAGLAGREVLSIAAVK